MTLLEHSNALDVRLYDRSLQEGMGVDLNRLHTLGRMTFGQRDSDTSTGMSHQHVAGQVLPAGAGSCEELWICREPTQLVSESGVVCRYNSDLLFGVIEIEEPTGAIAVTYSLEITTELAYQRLFETLDKYNFRYLWRTWNYIPDINVVTQGTERYRQFNAGRQKGFASGARELVGNVPAACALGVRGHHLSIAFLAGRQPTRAIENPRQVSAYHYPKQYGPLSPTFSRASLARLHQQELLFLSGTASIVGHETLHVGDVRKQTVETLENIRAVLAQASLQSQASTPYGVHDLQLRVYVRHTDDQPLIQSVLKENLGEHDDIVYIQADVCRSDLDVEIEGIAWKVVPEMAATTHDADV